MTRFNLIGGVNAEEFRTTYPNMRTCNGLK
jgi:hypothetical protein